MNKKTEWSDEEKNFINAIINSLDKDKLNRVWGEYLLKKLKVGSNQSS